MISSNNDIFGQWLSAEAQRVLAKIEADEPLTQDDKLIIVINGQMNHFHHLDVELRQDMRNLDIRLSQEVGALRADMDKRFGEVEKRFEQVDRRFEQVDRRFETIHGEIKDIHKEIKNIYQAINSQTWKMIGAMGLAMGLFVSLSKLIERL
ncbi:MAG: hypothetical protein BECKG1743D_GA0114223_103882 [Candidatus Kentron sp. G]|nr:MAG: hypothetical protein BECKG1743D_GA0114223_103882 [Candidatus Kentron sp. G]